MKQVLHQDKLDPRLKRIFQTRDVQERMALDVRRGVVASAPGPAGLAEATTSVLVALSAQSPPATLPDVLWTQIVDQFYSAVVPVDQLQALANLPGVEFIEAKRDLSPLLVSSIDEIRVDEVHQGIEIATGHGVVVGVIDFGLDFTLDDFRHQDGTSRVEFLWDQGLQPQAGEQTPEGFQVGVEYTRQQINEDLQSGQPHSIVRHDPGPGSHGTHVASTAAGNGRSGDNEFPTGQFVGMAPESHIIFVQPATDPQISTFTDSVRVAEGLAYIFRKADELGLPCVVNLSLGQNGGSHDGESIVERIIDRLLEQPGRAMAVAAGNEHVWRGHSSGQIEGHDIRLLRWGVGGQMPIAGVAPAAEDVDFSTNEVEVWYSSRDTFEIRVLSPDGAATDWTAPGETLISNVGGAEVFIDSERFSRVNGEARIYIEVSPQPFALTPGAWQIELHATRALDGHFDAWIGRDVRRSANNFSDQSFFVGTDFDHVKTIGTPSTGYRSLAVANYNHVLQEPNDASGRGTTRDGRAKPEVAAPGTNIFAANSHGGRPDEDNSGQPQPMRIAMSGTSMAAPHVAGVIALLLEHQPRLTATQIRSILIATASPPPGVIPYDVAWGYGRVDARAAVDLVLKY